MHAEVYALLLTYPTEEKTLCCSSHLLLTNIDNSMYARSYIIAVIPTLAGPSFKAFSYSDGELRGRSLDL